MVTDINSINNKKSNIYMLQPLGNLYIVSAPSGAGKSSIIKAVLARSQEKAGENAATSQVSISHTTRAPRPGEVDGVHYHFVDIPTFEQMVQDKAFYEYAEVFGNYYGTSKASVSDQLRLGLDVFLDIDWQGARQVKRLNPQAIGIFILPPSKKELRNRLNNRAQDSAEAINYRMTQAVNEMSHYNEFDYVVINDDFEQAVQDVEGIVLATRASITNQQIRHQGLLKQLLLV